jgi:Host cell surface-exposed lipoprotein.
MKKISIIIALLLIFLFTTACSQDVNLTLENEEHTITFMDNGEKYHEIKFVGESIIEKPADPEKDNYIFSHWATHIKSTDGSEIFDFNSTVNKSIHLFSHYIINNEPAEQANQETTGQRNAVKKAESYLSFSAFSRKRLIEQLEYEEFSTEDATYAVDKISPDWNEQAYKKAESYLKSSSFSKDRLISQLEYEGFTSEQAQYGADKAYQ